MGSRTTVKVVVTLLAVLLVLASCGPSAGTISAARPEAAAELIASDDVVLLDIRTPEEYDTGIIEGAVNIDFYAADFADRLRGLDKDVHYVVYCRSGNRSDRAMDTFHALGFTRVTEITGGILGWQSRGLSTVAP